MNKDLFLRLCLMMCVLFTLWQCSSEDFSLAENNPKRNNSEFFIHSSSGGLANRGGVDYVRILEAYNEEHNFLVTMPDQRGMPIWEKMRVLNSEVATGLIIPLSYDNETLSSVLFATLDDSNTVTGVKDYDNNLLEEIIYNQNLNKDFRQGILTSYLVTDHYTFNTTEFTNIPTDLFSGIKHGKDSIKLSFNGYVKEENSKSLGARLMISTTCLNIYHCKNNKPPSLCDGCSLCLTKTCETEYIFTDDDFPTMPPGNPGGGGGGTGTGTGPAPTNPGQQPPRDPCASATVFYRLMPGCGSTGTGDGGDLIDDPCVKAQPAINHANNILKNPNVLDKMDVALRAKASLPNEWAVALGINYTVSDPAEGTPTSSTPPVGNLGGNYMADGHSHAGGRGSPSASDMYRILQLSTSPAYPNFSQSYVYGINNGVLEVYALVVTDESLATDFLSQFPFAENYDDDTHWFKEETDLYKEADKIRGIYRQGNVSNTSGENHNHYALAMAYILERHNAGISLAKVDASGNLKKVKVSVEPTTTNGLPDEKIVISKCP